MGTWEDVSQGLPDPPHILWPPDHRLVEVKPIISVYDTYDPRPVVRLLSITSNEPDDGIGDGRTTGDILITPDGRIFLRAERSGKGEGRIYTLRFQALDSAGNSTTEEARVYVPHDKRNASQTNGEPLRKR